MKFSLWDMNMHVTHILAPSGHKFCLLTASYFYACDPQIDQCLLFISSDRSDITYIYSQLVSYVNMTQRITDALFKKRLD